MCVFHFSIICIKMRMVDTIFFHSQLYPLNEGNVRERLEREVEGADHTRMA